MQARFQHTPRPSGDQFRQSSGILERNFSHYMPFVVLILPYLSGGGKALVVPAGCLNGNPNIDPQDNIFCSEKVDWYEKALNAKVFEKFPE
jgi:hypothetical protein